MAERIAVTQEIIDNDKIDPNSKRHCYISEALGNAGYSKSQICVGIDSIVVVGKEYNCSEDLQDWQLQSARNKMIQLGLVNAQTDDRPFTPIVLEFSEKDRTVKIV